MGKLSRNKGRNGEYECINFWKDLFPDAHRVFEFRKREADKGIDVILDKWHMIQSKIGKSVPKKIYDFLNQMKLEKGEMGWVQCRRDREDWLVIIRASDFKELMKMLVLNNVIKIE